MHIERIAVAVTVAILGSHHALAAGVCAFPSIYPIDDVRLACANTGECDGIGAGGGGKLELFAISGTIECSNPQRRLAVVAFAEFVCPEDEPASSLETDFEKLDSFGWTQLCKQSLITEYSYPTACVVCAYAEIARTTTYVRFLTLAGKYARVEGGCWVGDPPEPTCYAGEAAGMAFAKASCAIAGGASLGASDWSGTLTVSFGASESPIGQITRQGLIFIRDENVSVYRLDSIGELVSASGLALNSGNGMWEASAGVSAGASPDASIAMFEFTFEDRHLDVNGDGRFSPDDVDALQGISEDPEQADDPEYVSKWDFDNSGEIDAEDVATLDSLVNAGVHSGVFGDLNGDGACNCLDESKADFGYSLGDAGYVVELDFHLDGVTDTYDECRFSLIMNGDLDADGDIDSTDMNILLSSFGTSVPTGTGGDLDCDGDVDSTDLNILLSANPTSCS